MKEDETTTKSRITLKYKGKVYSFIYDWECNYPIDSANYMWEEGSYSCDCNKRLFLSQYCGLPEVPDNELKCGDEIELLNIEHLNK